ncbi:hypothetical protein B484DRAFT_481556 [Ochromonadaceae sp. CCMP2298]|nr:hypothetical protein B484DRAFT_481556 [Ochromonadaceae sp. CCMP2298]
MVAFVALLAFLVCLACLGSLRSEQAADLSVSVNPSDSFSASASSNFSASSEKIAGVMVTTVKDSRAFEKSIVSALKHLVDVDKFYVVSPDAGKVKLKMAPLKLGPRVVYVDESIFPFDWKNVSGILYKTAEERGVYPLTGKSPFESTMWGRVGWFLQQLLKFYAGRVLGLGSYVLLDSDITWFRDVRFVNSSSHGVTRYNYAVSSQYHPAYVATLQRISGHTLVKNADAHRSGIVHHMVLSQPVLEDLFTLAEGRYGGIPFWQVLLNESAVELTCRAPRSGICGAGSTLSEYELYFNFARTAHPDTVALRPLLWANGPAPGLMFWPPVETAPHLHSDGPKWHWVGHRQSEIPEAMRKQAEADAMQGFDFVAYHGYGKRRYFEMIDADISAVCAGVPEPRNSTCSWRGLEDDPAMQRIRTPQDWFAG